MGKHLNVNAIAGLWLVAAITQNPILVMNTFNDNVEKTYHDRNKVVNFRHDRN